MMWKIQSLRLACSVNGEDSSFLRRMRPTTDALTVQHLRSAYNDTSSTSIDVIVS